jgi:hypothetical protein
MLARVTQGSDHYFIPQNDTVFTPVLLVHRPLTAPVYLLGLSQALEYNFPVQFKILRVGTLAYCAKVSYKQT